MLGHAMDFFIPGVPLEQIRFAGLRLQRGGVGFYPTSGSPFVHLDTGSIRHWPGMTHDQLVRVFPDGRTVHLPTDGKPLKGYELARADIEARDGSDSALKKSSPSLWANLFKRKSNDDDDDEAVSTPVPTAQQVADAAQAIAAAGKAADAKSAEATAKPRSKPQTASAFQLASADAQIVQPAKPKPAAADTAEAKPQSPADIINARGFWGDAAAAPQQATPAQVASLRARQAVAPVDPQSTASVPSAMQALAYAPASASPVDRANIVAASAPIPRSARPAPRNAAAVATEINTIAAKGTQGQDGQVRGVIANSTRISAAKGNDIWLRVVMLAPSASNSMFTTVLGDTDMTLMRNYFAKPQAVVAMSFSDDPQMGLLSERFTGSATAKLTTTSFVLQTASLR
jgi:hypothetical protein